ncbi:hypothetical protein JKF63_00876 [Porcisia hertigi]|uniref:Uncharacterized protein n=1 Tax=Porcisia hertigi TaxID=2761500 RepID=A0A836HDV6_9TRYP|nr:hypothetical protein JKF63_00876 [Porcisia hertigi]
MMYPRCGDVEAVHFCSYAGKHSGRSERDSVSFMEPQAVLHQDPSSSSNAVQGALEAFVNSREEDAVSFVSSFLHLTPNDRVNALAKLEAHQELPPPVNAEAGDVGWQNPRPAASFTELHQRLQRHEAQVRRRALEEVHSRDVEEERSEPLSSIKSPKQISTRRWPLNAKLQATSADAKPWVTAHGEEEELEIVKLGDETRTGNIVAFVEGYATEVPTSFDNFVDTAAASCTLQDDSDVSVPIPLSRGSLPTLDEILSVDDNKTQKKAEVPLESPRSSQTGAPSVTEATLKTLEQHPHSPSGSTASRRSSVDSFALPGLLEDAPVNFQLHYDVFPDTPNTGLLAELKEVIAEENNCVEPFTLDPLFDYDADVLGKAFRAGTAWRRERCSR